MKGENTSLLQGDLKDLSLINIQEKPERMIQNQREDLIIQGQGAKAIQRSQEEAKAES